MKKRPFTESLKRAITESGLSNVELERATGIQRASLWRFMVNERTLRLDRADTLAEFFGLTVNTPKAKRGK